MTRFFEWLGNLFFGRRRTLDRIAESLRSIEIQMESSWEAYLAFVKKATENMSAAQQALVRALGAFERSDLTFEKIGILADKMAAREVALEEALIAKAKATVQEAKKTAIEAEEMKRDLAAHPYDDKF